MVSMTLALLTVLPARRAFLTGAAALLAAPVAKAPPAMSPAPILALPAPVAVADPILSAIRAHRRAWAAFQVALTTRRPRQKKPSTRPRRPSSAPRAAPAPVRTP